VGKGICRIDVFYYNSYFHLSIVYEAKKQAVTKGVLSQPDDSFKKLAISAKMKLIME